MYLKWLSFQVHYFCCSVTTVRLDDAIIKCKFLMRKKLRMGFYSLFFTPYSTILNCIINDYQSSETMMGIYHVCRFSVQIYSSGTRQIQNSVFIDYFCIIDSRLQHVLGVSSPTYSGAYNLPRDKRRIYCLNAEDVADI